MRFRRDTSLQGRVGGAADAIAHGRIVCMVDENKGQASAPPLGPALAEIAAEVDARDWQKSEALQDAESIRANLRKLLAARDRQVVALQQNLLSEHLQRLQAAALGGDPEETRYRVERLRETLVNCWNDLCAE